MITFGICYLPSRYGASVAQCLGVRLESGRPAVRILLALWGFFWVESYESCLRCGDFSGSSHTTPACAVGIFLGPVIPCAVGMSPGPVIPCAVGIFLGPVIRILLAPWGFFWVQSYRAPWGCLRVQSYRAPWGFFWVQSYDSCLRCGDFSGSSHTNPACAVGIFLGPVIRLLLALWGFFWVQSYDSCLRCGGFFWVQSYRAPWGFFWVQSYHAPWGFFWVESYDSCLRCGDFSASSHTSDVKIGTPVATLPGAWRYWVSAVTE